MNGIGVLFEPCFYSAGFDPRLRLGCTQKLIICTEACGTAWLIVCIGECSEILYLVKPLDLATGQALLSV